MTADPTLTALRATVALQRPRTIARDSAAYLALAHYLYHQYVHEKRSFAALADNLDKSTTFVESRVRSIRRRQLTQTLRPTPPPDLRVCDYCHGAGEAEYAYGTNCCVSSYTGVCHNCAGPGFTVRYATYTSEAAALECLTNIAWHGQRVEVDLLVWVTGVADSRALYAFIDRHKDSHPEAAMVFPTLKPPRDRPDWPRPVKNP